MGQELENVAEGDETEEVLRYSAWGRCQWYGLISAFKYVKILFCDLKAIKNISNGKMLFFHFPFINKTSQQVLSTKQSLLQVTLEDKICKPRLHNNLNTLFLGFFSV